MKGKFSNVGHIYLLLATITQFLCASSSHLLYRNGVKRQNGICLNHTSGEFDRNPNDCRSFYLCLDNGQAVMAPCPPTMLFNPNSKLCDTADNVNCDMGIPSSGNNSNANDGYSGNASNTDGSNSDDEELKASRYCASQPAEQNRIIFLGSSSSCQQYYICYYGQAVLQECSANLHWNVNTAKCDLPEKAGCPLWSENTGIGAIEQENEGGLNGNGASGNEIGIQTVNSELINCPIYGQHVFPHMTRCNYFIYCVKGHAMLQKCPFYYHFDIVSKSCKMRTVAICVRDLNINFRKLNP